MTCAFFLNFLSIACMRIRCRSPSGLQGVGGGRHHPPISPLFSVYSHPVHASMSLRKIVAQRAGDIIRCMEKGLQMIVVDIARAADRTKATIDRILDGVSTHAVEMCLANASPVRPAGGARRWQIWPQRETPRRFQTMLLPPKKTGQTFCQMCVRHPVRRAVRRCKNR